MKWILAVLAASVAFAGCKRLGEVVVDFEWQDKRDPDEQLYISVIIEQRTDPLISENKVVGTAGPVLLPPGQTTTLKIDFIQPGDQRVAIFEAREFPGRDSPLRYYAISDHFATKANHDVHVPLLIRAVRPPALPEGGEAIRIETETGFPFVRDPNVRLILFTDRGVGARISNERNLLDDRTMRMLLVETSTRVVAPEGFLVYEKDWDLNFGLSSIETEPGQYPREVHLRFFDKNGFESVPASARVTLDSEPPSLREGTAVEPRYVSPTTRIKATLVISELLRFAPEIAVRDADGVTFERLLPATDGPSNTYTYLSSAPGAASLPDGEYTIVVRNMIDLAGNLSEEVELDTVVLDGVPPVISDLTVSPERTASGTISIGLTIDEDDPPDRLEFTVGANVVQDCKPIGTRRVECDYVLTGSEVMDGDQNSVAVRAFATDKALNSFVLQGSIFVDRRAPRLESMTFAPRYAGAGTRAVFRSVTSEATAGPPVLIWLGGRDPGFVWSATASADIDHVFLLDVNASSEAGDFAIERIELTDDLGNLRVHDASNDPRFPLAFTIDNVPPRVFDIAVPPVPVGLHPGAIVTLDFAVDEERPAGPPRVSLQGMDISSTCTMGQVTGTITRWSCRYVVTGMELVAPAVGLFTFRVEVQDFASGFGSGSVPVTFDFQPPSLNAAIFTPAAASNGDVGELYLAASEPLEPRSVPMLGWTGPSVSMLHQATRATSSERYFEIVVGPNVADGRYILSTVAIRDAAGNDSVASSGVLPLEWLVDKTAPQIQNLTVRVCTGPAASSCGVQTTPPRVPAIAGRVLRVEFTENEGNPAEVSVHCGTRDLSSSCTFTGAAPSRSWTCLYTTTANEYPAGTETTEACVADLADRSSNRASASVPLVWDFAPPALSSISILPSPGGLGATAILTMVFSEELETGFIPALTFSPANRSVPFVHQSSTPFQRVFTYAITSASTPRTYSLASVSARDIAGNNATINAAPLPLSWLLDNVAPVIGPITVTVPDATVATTPPRINRTAGRTINVTFTVTEANLVSGTPRVLIGAINISSSCTSSGSAPTVTWTCSYAMTGSEPGNGTETIQIIDVRAGDTAGNTANASASVVFDFDSPGLIASSANVQLVPAATNRLATVARVTAGTTIELRFETDEPTIVPHTVSATPGTLAFTHQPRAGNVFLYTHTLASNVSCNPDANEVCGRTFRIVLTDLAGNSATIANSGASFTIDTSVPDAAAVDSSSLIVLDRRPWGDATDPDPRMSLSGDAAAVEENSTVIVSSVFDVNAEITRITAAADGSIPSTLLYAADAPTVRLEVLDAAGNVSPPVNVRDALIKFTMNGKEPGHEFPNPHELTFTPQIQETVDQTPRGGLEREATLDEIAAALQPDLTLLTSTAKPSWQLYQLSNTGPGLRQDHGMAYDPRRGRTVVFGGSDPSGGLNNETWEHDGERWSLANPIGPRPSARTRPLMVYDAAHESVMLIGGEIGTTTLNDVWLYDGASWTLTSPAPFAPRRGATIGYHGERGVVVMFGGRNGANVLLNETWIWNDSTMPDDWVQGPLLGSPHVREDAAMGYLPPRGVLPGHLVLFGGRGTAGRRNDTWSWNGFWTQHAPATTPPSLTRASMATDPDAGNFNTNTYAPRVVMFGGEGVIDLSNSTWTWDGTNWTNRTPTSGGFPYIRVAPFVYDARENRFLTYGGRGPNVEPVLWDTWAWNGELWADLTESLFNPPPSYDFAFAASDQQAIVFSGNGGAVRPWLFGQYGAGWTYHNPSGLGILPAERRGHAMASYLIGAARRFVMFGGAVPGQTAFLPTDTWVWEYNAANPGWTSYTSPAALVERAEHAMARGMSANEVVLFGGLTPSGLSNQTWVFNGNNNPPTWTQRSSVGCTQWPSARESMAMVHDPTNSRVVMFGGLDSIGARDDLWTWNGTCWSQIARPSPSTPWPVARRNAMAVHDPDRGRVLLIGGGVPDTNVPPNPVDFDLGDVWALGTSATQPWLDATPDPSHAPPRFSGGAFYDAARKQIAMFGGQDHHEFVSDQTFVLSSGKNHRPGIRFSAEWGAALVEREAIQSVTVTAIAGGYGYRSSPSGYVSGAVLRLWDAVAGRWIHLQANNASETSPQALTFSTASPGAARRFVSGASDRIEAQITTLFVDFGRELAEVSLDHIEVQVGYRL